MLLRLPRGARSPLGHITLAAFGVRQRVALHAWRVLGQYALMLVNDGAGTYADANGHRQRLAAGDMVVVFPELAHLYNPDPDTEWIVSYLCFEGALFDLWRERGELDARRPVYPLRPLATWGARFERILAGANEPGLAPPLVEVGRLQAFLAEVVTGAGDAGTSAEDADWIQRARRLLEAASGDAPDWAGIAGRLGASVESFRKRFKRLTGESPGRYHAARRVERACALMREGRMTDRQIAAALGFCDEFYFSRRFRQITGKSPRAFRRWLALATGGDPA